MKAIAAILLLAMTGAALAETGKPADQPVTVYKAGKPYIFDGRRIRCSASCPAPSVGKPEVETKPAPKAVG